METSESEGQRIGYKLDLGDIQNLEHELPRIYDIKDRFEHFYILGKSGMGKSVLLERMAQYDIEQGISTIFIDPKGECVKKLYHLSEDKEKIIYISRDNPLTINPLQKKGYSLDNIIDEFVNVLDVLITLTSINPESSVRMKEIIGMALKSFTPDQMNMKYLAEFLHYEENRKRHSFTKKDQIDYWKEFDAKQGNFYKNRGHQDTAKSVSSRLLQFVNDEEMKPFVLGDNELYISDILRSGKSLLVDTSGFTQVKRIFISNLIIHAVASYCLYEKLNIPLMVYVDEFQTVSSELFTDVLEFGRGAKVGFTVAHHNFNEIKKREIISAIFGIVSNFCVFRCGDEEAKRLSNIYGIKEKELIDLKKYNAWVRLGIENTLIETFPPLMKETPEVNLRKSKIIPISFLRDSWIPFT